MGIAKLCSKCGITITEKDVENALLRNAYMSLCCNADIVDVQTPDREPPTRHNLGGVSVENLAQDRATDPQWNAWAHAELAKRYRAINQAQEEVVSLKKQVELLQKDAARKDGAILGLNEVINARKGGFECLDIGSLVMTPGGKTATVTGIFIDRGGVQYWIRWWEEGKRIEIKVDCTEVEEIEPGAMPKNTSAE